MAIVINVHSASHSFDIKSEDFFYWSHPTLPVVADCLSFYKRLSPLFDTFSIDNSDRTIPRFEHLLNDKNFNFLYHLAHNDIVLLDKSDCLEDLYDVLGMVCTYQLPDKIINIVVQAVLSKVDYSSILFVLDQPRIFNSELSKQVEHLLIQCPVDTILKYNTRVSNVTITYLTELLSLDTVNCTEYDLFEALLKKKWSLECIRSCVRFKDMNFEQLMSIRQKYPDLFSDAEYMAVFSSLNKDDSNKRKYLCKYGYFPLHISAFSQPVVLTLQSVRYTIGYLICTVDKNAVFSFPTFHCCAGSMNIQTQTNNTHLGLKGQLNMGIQQNTMHEKPQIVTVEVRLLNHQKEIKKVHQIRLNDNAFVIDRLIMLHTLQNGYLFEGSLYPLIESGSQILMRLSVAAIPV